MPAILHPCMEAPSVYPTSTHSCVALRMSDPSHAWAHCCSECTPESRLTGTLSRAPFEPACDKVGAADIRERHTLPHKQMAHATVRQTAVLLYIPRVHGYPCNI